MTTDKNNYNDNYKKNHKINLKPGWCLLYYDDNKHICSKYIPSIENLSYLYNYTYNDMYNELNPIKYNIYKERKNKIFDEYVKNINEYKNIRKELYDEDFSYLDKYLEEKYEIYTENDIYSSDMDSNDDNDYNYYNYNNRKFDI